MRAVTGPDEHEVGAGERGYFGFVAEHDVDVVFHQIDEILLMAIYTKRV